MHIHILGICGTFMGGIALLAREMGMEVSGSDTNVYPPMSTQLEQAGITLMALDDLGQFKKRPNVVVIGNAMSRGNPAVEHVLNKGIAYTSGPAFLAEHILKDRWVLAVAGTHGKTSTSAMLAWILEYAGLTPGFLIGGIPENFGVSARSGNEPFFVVEADEYDTAFFDKRSKFVHYHPRTLILNNLEFDHADIFDDLNAIKRQVHHLVRTVPGEGLIIYPQDDDNLADVISMGCWTDCETISMDKSSGSNWLIDDYNESNNQFSLYIDQQKQATVDWSLLGLHNVSNASVAIAAARHAGVPVKVAAEAMQEFKNVKRRMEVIARLHDITLYDDFAHHPTAITTTLDGLRKKVGSARILAVLEPRSNTMKMGIHEHTLGQSLNEADQVLLFQPADLGWDLSAVLESTSSDASSFSSVEQIVEQLITISKPGDHILIMSNGGFGGIHLKLIDALNAQMKKTV